MLTEQQKKERLQGVGGSDVPIILGLSSYKTPYQLFLEKTGQIEDTKEETQLQYWGNRLEPLIVDEFKVRNKVDIEHPDTIIHPFHDFLRANIDGFIPEWNSVFEAKSSSAFMSSEWGEDGSDFISLAYLVQLVHYVSCTNANNAHLAVLIGGNDYREFVYTRDLELESRVIDASKDFWACVQKNIPPAPIDIDDLKLMYPSSTPLKTKSCDNVSRGTLEALSLVKQKQKKLAELENKHKFALIEYMKDCEALTDKDGKTLATYKSNKKGARTFLLKGA